MSNIQYPTLQEAANRIVNTTKLAMEKVAANYDNQANYPLTSDKNTIEQLMLARFQKLPERTKIRVVKKTLKNLSMSDNDRKLLYGDLSKVNLHSPISIDEQVKKIPFRPGLYPDQAIEYLKKQQWTKFHPSNITRPSTIPNPPDEVITTMSIIERKYQKLGGPSGWLGPATSAEMNTSDGKGKVRHYTRGSIYWTKSTHAHAVQGGIREKWKSVGAEKSFIGYPITDEIPTSDRLGAFSNFERGSIYWTPRTGVHSIQGGIREKWYSLGAENGILGYPTTDELNTARGTGKFNHFFNEKAPGGVDGSIYWTPGGGAHEIHGAVREKWASIGAEMGILGYPTSDTMFTDGFSGFYNNFQGATATGIPLAIRSYPDYGKTYIASQDPLKFITLKVTRLLCNNETDPEGGEDEMYMGGSSTDGYGNVTQFPSFGVGEDYEAGIAHGPWDYCRYPLNHMDNIWSKTFHAIINLAESDDGGDFQEWIENFLAKYKEEIRAYAVSVGVSIGAGIGTAIFPGLGTLVGAIVGAIAGWAVDQAIKWIKSWWEDDIFAPGYTNSVIPGPYGLFGDGAETIQRGRFTYNGDGGIYTLDCQWELHN